MFESSHWIWGICLQTQEKKKSSNLREDTYLCVCLYMCIHMYAHICIYVTSQCFLAHPRSQTHNVFWFFSLRSIDHAASSQTWRHTGGAGVFQWQGPSSAGHLSKCVVWRRRLIPWEHLRAWSEAFTRVLCWSEPKWVSRSKAWGRCLLGTSFLCSPPSVAGIWGSWTPAEQHCLIPKLLPAASQYCILNLSFALSDFAVRLLPTQHAFPQKRETSPGLWKGETVPWWVLPYAWVVEERMIWVEGCPVRLVSFFSPFCFYWRKQLMFCFLCDATEETDWREEE